jgi:hypothetical protein
MNETELVSIRQWLKKKKKVPRREALNCHTTTSTASRSFSKVLVVIQL